ncbi:MAG: RNA polymerase sigma-70 factor [Candidatus Symbiothrix sp.]|jgi:RNA polymerase sigma-70 factor (ECF subfamily)|nr:RNA polymerase sigma-70 factor [Candidatus Symbiothrix sp.]
MVNPPIIDIGTLNALRHGNKDAFESIFRAYNAKIYNFALATLYDKSYAKDITQNVFLAVWEHRKKIVPKKNFQAYLFTIARNLIYRQTEKMVLGYQYENYIKNHYREEDASSEKKIDAGSLEELMIQLIKKLPEARRRVFLLSFKEELSPKEIAEKLTVSEKTVETQIRRSLKYIKKHLKNYMTAMAFLYMQ